MVSNSLKIGLAGYNVDRDAIQEIITTLKSEKVGKDEIDKAIKIAQELTPETIAASYARISRDPDPIPKLREKARRDVKGARESYNAINFKMGHKSIAEHVVLNFDIMGVSRRVVEEIEKKRLQSYTEKSQRYITLDGDFVIPKEIQGTPLESKFIELVEKQNNFYDKNLVTLQKFHNGHKGEKFYQDLFKDFECLDNPNKQDGLLQGFGKEDARYALAQATQAQLGMTLSARNLENLITALRSSNIAEVKDVGTQLYRETIGLAPSVIKYTEPTDYFSKTRPELKEHVSNLIEKHNFKPLNYFGNYEVEMYHPSNEDTAIMAGLIFSSTDMSFINSLNLLSRLNHDEKVNLVWQADKYQEKHDPKLREFELGTRFGEFVMSASAFAQIKRHRMNTLISQDYNPSLSVTIPKSIRISGLEDDFLNVTSDSTNLYYDMLDEGLPKIVAEYALTNAHKRGVLLDANNRQVHAISAERENLAAQWDIRNLITQYVGMLKDANPYTLGSACGKHAFNDVKAKRM